MDYVKETLQRQSAVWTALFVGGEEIEAAEQETMLEERAAEKFAAESLLTERGAKQRVEETLSAEPYRDDAGGRTQAETELLQRGREKILRELTFQKWQQSGGEENGGRKPTEETETLAAETARWETEAALREGRHDLETADARAISRRFERDARRYDGGFVFY